MTLQVGTAAGKLDLDLSGLRRGYTEAKQIYADLASASAQLPTASAPVPRLPAQAPSGGGGGARNAADEALRLAQARARLAQANGDVAGAERILGSALAASTGASERATIAVQTQAARLQTSRTYAQQFGDAMKSSLLGIVGPAAAAGAAIAAINQAGELIKLGAQAEQTERRFNAAAEAAGTTGQALTKALRAASAGTISDLNLQLATNRARLLGVANSAAELAPLLEIARDRAQEMGISTTQAFNDLVTGLGRGSALILDNLGITVNVTEANNAYAQSIGKTASALTEAEQKQALINAVLTQGKASLDATGGAAETNAAKLERATASIDNARAALGKLFALRAGPLADDIAQLTDSLTGATSAGQGFAGAFKLVADITSTAKIPFEPISQYNAAVFSAARSTLEWAGALGPASDALQAQAAAEAEEIGVKQSYIAATQFQAQAAAQAAAAEAFRRSEHQSSIGVTQQAADLSLIDAAAKEKETLQTQLLQEQTRIAAEAFLAANPGITESGIRAQIAAGLIPSLIGQLALLTLQIREAKAELGAVGSARISRQAIGGVTDADEIRTGRQRQLKEDRDARVAAGQAAAEAEAQYQRQLGNTGPLLARRRQELAGLKTGSEAYYKKLQEIAALEQQGARGGGGGGGRVAAQQKFHNQLIDNETKVQQKLEDLAREHGRNVLKIEADFQKKSFEQQRANEISKRASRANFYDALTQATKDIGPKEAQALSADYEAAYAKAQELAQAGQAKLAADYLAFKEAQIRAEIEYQQQLAEARKKGDEDEIARLQTIHKMRQDEAAEREKQLLEGGDANVRARDEALASEEERYAEAQGKVETASDRATDRLVTNAERRSGALDAENQKLREQAAIYDHMGGGGPLPPTGASAPPPPPAAAAAGAAPPPAVAGGGQVWQVSDGAVLAAINAQTEALSSRIDATNGKLDILINRVGAVESAIRSNGNRAVSK